MKHCWFKETGAALMPCTLLLVIVLLSSGSALRAALLQQAAAWTLADMHTARNAAEVALADAEHHLQIIDEPLSPAGSGAEHDIGSVTGERVTPSGAARPPYYRVDLISAKGSNGLCRITATGTGRRTSTRIILQADFEITSCSSQSDTAEPSESAQDCTRKVRQISWREVDPA